MASVYGMLGQSAPGATTLTACYTVPASKHATVRVVAANRAASADTIRIAVSPNGAAITDAQYLAYNKPVEANDSVASAAFTVGDGDIVRVYTTGGNTSFTVTGIEEDD